MSWQPATKVPVPGVISIVILIALLTPAPIAGGGQPTAKPAFELAPQESTPPLFLPVVTYGSGGLQAASVASADVNGDGKLDVVVANNISAALTSGSVGVLLGNGDGTFEPTVAYDSGGNGTSSVAVADVNSDGRPDLLVANTCATAISSGTCSSNGSVGVLLGNGDGTFRTAVNYDPGRPGSSSNSIAVADVNGDGHPDLAVGNFNSSVSILLGHGDGTFQLTATYTSEAEFSVSVADVNGDARPDLLVANLHNKVAVLLGNGDGTFQAAVVYDPGGFDATSVTAKDVNGDGRPDLLVSNWFVSNQDFHSNGVLGVLLGNGDGTFQPAVTFDSGGQQPASIAVADANADGKLDVVMANLCPFSGSDICLGKSVGVLLGKGDGTFEPAMTYDSGGFGGLSIAGADVNGDGRPDLLVANDCATPIPCFSDGSVGVLLNNTADTTPPVITISAAPQVLWPPNGKMVSVRVSGTITDTGSRVTVNSAAYAVKDEYGEVEPQGAITVGPDGNYSFTILLRASRRSTDRDGRRYTVTVRAMDNAGNDESQTSAVTVPHDQTD